MKKIKNSIAFFVALATVCVVLSSYSTVFKKNAKADITECFSPDIEVSQFCNFSDDIYSFTDCSTASYYENGALINLNPLNYVDNRYVDCPSDQVFCCATVRESGQICIGQPTLNLGEGSRYYRVDQVYCKDL